MVTGHTGVPARGPIRTRAGANLHFAIARITSRSTSGLMPRNMHASRTRREDAGDRQAGHDRVKNARGSLSGPRYLLNDCETAVIAFVALPQPA